MLCTTFIRFKFIDMMNIFRRRDSKAGFTLIELLVVIAIIGILASIVLASLNTARVKSRDARRIADLKQLQLAQELYFDSNASYVPGVYTALAAALVPTYIPGIPQDPLGVGRTYLYQAITAAGAACSSAPCPSYVLRAHLEENNLGVLSNDVDGTVVGVDCGTNPEVTPNWFYCLRP